MRVVHTEAALINAVNMTRSEVLDKDSWRSGDSPEAVLAKYEKLYSLVFGDATTHFASAPIYQPEETAL